MQRVLGLILCLFLANSCLADEIVDIQFRTEPPSVKVYQGRHYLGMSDTRLKFEISGTGDLQLRFVADGYYELERFIPAQRLKRSKIYPKTSDPPIRLSPKNWLVRMRSQPLLVGALTVLFAAAGWLLALRIKLTRARLSRESHLKRLDSKAGEGGSLLMKTVGNYRLVSELGRGGMSVVYRGIPEDSLDESAQVAVKVLARELSDEQDNIERFRREINLSKNLVHPNIVRLLDFGDHNGRMYLVQEVLSGDTLRAQLRPEGMPSAEAIAFLKPIFSAVHYAHTQAIVHRDLKPENIMLDEGQIKVGDFGLAKSADSKKLTKTGTTLGTPSYMAPEQIQEGTIDPRTDQYALGVIVYELLSGNVPFDADDPIKVIFKHLMEPPVPLSEVQPNLSREVSDTVTKMLAKDPDDRYSSVQEAGDALFQALTN